MKIEEIITEKCWQGYKQVGMKKKGDRMVPNCVPIRDDMELDDVTLEDDQDFHEYYGYPGYVEEDGV